MSTEYPHVLDTPQAQALAKQIANLKERRSRCEKGSPRYYEMTNAIYNLNAELHRLRKIAMNNRTARPS